MSIQPKKGCRFAYNSRNGRTLFNNLDYFQSFFNKVQSSEGTENEKLTFVSKVFKDQKQKTKVLLELGMFCSLWCYLIAPIWSFFSTPKRVDKTKIVLKAILDFAEKGTKARDRALHLTHASSIFAGINEDLRPPSDESVIFCQKYIDDLNQWRVCNLQFSPDDYDPIENFLKKFFDKFLNKYKKEYESFIQMDISSNELIRVTIMPMNNQKAESVFGFMKHVSQQFTNDENLIAWTCVKVNDTVTWAY